MYLSTVAKYATSLLTTSGPAKRHNPFFHGLYTTAAGASSRVPPLATQPHTSQYFSPSAMITLFFPLQWPPAPVADTSVRLPPLAEQLFRTPFLWPTATAVKASAMLPSLTTQTHTSLFTYCFLSCASFNFPLQDPEAVVQRDTASTLYFI